MIAGSTDSTKPNRAGGETLQKASPGQQIKVLTESSLSVTLPKTFVKGTVASYSLGAKRVSE